MFSMACSTAQGAYHPNIPSISPADMDYLLLHRDDDGLLDVPDMLKAPATPCLHSSPLTFLPCLRDPDNTHPARGNGGSFHGDITQAMAMKRPVFWPFVAEVVEGMKGSYGLSPDHSAAHEHSACTSEFCNNVSISTVMVEKMIRSSAEPAQYSNGELELHNMNEGESRMCKKRRLTVDQVRMLEGSFEAGKKLEAEQKQELAHRLGLEPRQVSVWFQNRRARSKAKNLEHDFILLKSKYHFMLAETQKLRSEVLRLTALLEATKAGYGGGEPEANHLSTKEIRSKMSTMEGAAHEQSVNPSSHAPILKGNSQAEYAVLMNSTNQHLSSSCTASPASMVSFSSFNGELLRREFGEAAQCCGGQIKQWVL